MRRVDFFGYVASDISFGVDELLELVVGQLSVVVGCEESFVADAELKENRFVVQLVSHIGFELYDLFESCSTARYIFEGR